MDIMIQVGIGRGRRGKVLQNPAQNSVRTYICKSRALDITALISSAVHDATPLQSLPVITADILRKDEASLLVRLPLL